MYRDRKAQNAAFLKKVTHQGSPESGCNDLLNPAPKTIIVRISSHCDFCGKPCNGFARVGFYKQRSLRAKVSFLAQGP
jgi:hypothetical protein